MNMSLADLNEREKARLIAIEDGYHKLSKPQDEKGTFRTRAAIGVEIEDRYGISLQESTQQEMIRKMITEQE